MAATRKPQVSVKAQRHTYSEFQNIKKQNLKYVRKASRQLQCWNRRLDRAQLRTEQQRWLCELH